MKRTKGMTMKSFALMLFLIPALVFGQEWRRPGGDARVANLKIYNVLDYGVSPDVADNSAALQALIRQMNPYTGSKGGVIYIPAGDTIKFATTLRLDSSQVVSIVGQGGAAGEYGSVLQFTGTGQAITANNPNGIFLRRVGLENLTLIGNANCTDLFYACYTGNLTLKNVDLANCTGKAIHIGNSIVTNLDNIRIYYGSTRAQYGIFLDSLASLAQTTTLIHNMDISGTSVAGVYLANAQNVSIIGGTSESNTGWGIILGSMAALNRIDAVDVEANTLGGIYCAGDNNVFSQLYCGDPVRVVGSANTFSRLRIVNDSLYLAASAEMNVIDGVQFGGTGAMKDSTIHAIYSGVYNKTTGRYIAEDQTANGFSMVKTNKMKYKVNYVHRIYGTAAAPGGGNGIKFSLYDNNWYCSSAIDMLNEGNDNGGSWLKFKTHPRTWTDTDASMTTALVLGPSGEDSRIMALHTLAAGDSVFGKTFIRSADTVMVFWNGTSWQVIKDLNP